MNNDQKFESGYVEPIRGSMFILLSKIILFMIMTDVIYLIVRIFTFDLNKHWFPHRDITFGFIIFLSSLYVLQIYFIVTILLNWLHRIYFFEENRLVERKGIFTIKERIYDLRNVKSVIVSQNLLGKLVKFGNITVVITSFNMREEINLYGVPKPQEIKEGLKKFI